MTKLNKEKFEMLDLVPQLINYSASKYGDKIAVSYYVDKKNIKNKTYNELQRDIKRMAFYLKENNHNSKVICLIGACSYEWIVSFYAIIWAGFYPALIDNGLSAEETMKLVHIADSRSVIVEDIEKKKELTDNLKKEKISVIGFKHSKQNLFGHCVEDIIVNEKHEMEQFANKNADDTALIVYTSGTIGNNKAVMLSHRNLCAGLAISTYVFGNDKHVGTVAVLPTHHMLELTAGIQTPIYTGIPICIGKGKRYIVQSISKFKPSALVLVPSIIEMMRKKVWANARLTKKENKLYLCMKISNLLLKIGIDVRRKIFKSILESFGGNLKTIISGGAPLGEETIKEFHAWGIEIYNGYGITECSPVVACNTPVKIRNGSVGAVNLEPLCKVKIVEKEICVFGDVVMKGYYRNEKATKEAFMEDGYFKTGDMGSIDADGFLYITGRKKNLIILSNGENLAPEELELIFSEIDGVKKMIVHSKKVGNETILGAIVVPTAEAKKKNDLQKYFNDEFSKISATLPPQKRIYEVDIRNRDFIMSSSGKVKRIKENYKV